MASPPSTAEVSVPIYAAAPLPPGWTEHRAPTGQFYYYHAASGESTYVRPSVQLPIPNQAREQDSNGVISLNPSGSEKKSSSSTKKKEKPKTKEPIPETDWVKVTTTAGNVFYNNLETKVSSWTIPDEIKEQLKRYEDEKARKLEEVRLAELEQARLKAEEIRRAHEAEQRRLIELEVQKVRAEVEAEAQLRGLKRKNEEPPPVAHGLPPKPTQPLVNNIPPNDNNTALDRQTKIPKVDDADDNQDEEWQRQIAEEMAQEAAEQSNVTIYPVNNSHLATNRSTTAPVGLSPEELKATFKAMLLEKSIDPMAPWDNELPKFVTDARYLALPSMKERRDLFDEFCKEKIRQQRAAKQAAPKVDPPQGYRSLLVEFVTSTRTLWEDFKSKHKKDPRFRNFGRDDREREKVFKSWLKELGEQKRQQLMKAEEDFRKMLSEQGNLEEEWKDFKDRMKNDSRFSAISSNSSKESLWKLWREESKNNRYRSGSTNNDLIPVNSNEEEKRVKQEASLKAREEQVREMKRKLEKQSAQTKNSAGREEAERDFKSFLIDNVRDHDVDWSDTRADLKHDSRYETIKFLPQDELRRLFYEHTDSIYSKRVGILESFFDQYVAQPLIADFSPIKKSLLKLVEGKNDGDDQMSDMSSEERMKLTNTIERLIGGNDRSQRSDRREGMELVEKKFKDWKARKEEKAHREFEEMCGESSFIEFWCRMKKAAQEKRKEVGNSTTIGDQEDEDEDQDDLVDLREMAKAIDIREIQMVLRNDKRWMVWDHLPEQRENWIRNYLDKLAAPKKTVYQKDL